jgi:NAD+ kinase
MGGVYITLRMRLRCELFRNGKPIPGKVYDVLNEVVVDRGSNPYLCKIECYERSRLITKVKLVFLNAVLNRWRILSVT